MSITPYIITNDEWTAISTKGLRGSCWLDFDSDDEEGRVDIRIFSTSGTPTDADLTNSPRVFKPIDNNGYYKIDPSSGSDIFYARAFNAGDQGTLLVSLNPNSKDVNLQDQTTPDVILRMNRVLGNFVLDGVQTRDSYILNVVAGHGATAGEWICIQQFDEEFQLPRFFQALIITAGTTTLEVDKPLDYAFDPAEVLCSERARVNMAGEVGTTSAPIIYKVAPKSGVWDITRIIPQFFTSGAMDDGKFASIDALVHGITFRRKNSFWYNSWNFKTNGDWAGIAFDTRYADKPPAGTGNGFTGRLTWAGQNKIGVAKRVQSALFSGLTYDDSLEIVLPDSLAALADGDFIGFIVEGHVVVE